MLYKETFEMSVTFVCVRLTNLIKMYESTFCKQVNSVKQNLLLPSTLRNESLPVASFFTSPFNNADEVRKNSPPMREHEVVKESGFSGSVDEAANIQVMPMKKV